VPHTEGAHAGLANRGEGLRQEVVEGFPVREPLAELDSLVLEVLVAEVLEIVFQVIYRVSIVLEASQKTTLTYAERALEYVGHRLLQFWHDR
jgi:hypothetical protein